MEKETKNLIMPSAYIYDTKNNTNDHLRITKSDKKATGKRKFHKKSRNGCTTCKRRRVKCDETKPICARCERMGIECVYLSAEVTSGHKENNTESTLKHPGAASLHKTESNKNPMATQIALDSLLQQQGQAPETPRDLPPPIPLGVSESLSNLLSMSPMTQLLQQCPLSPVSVPVATAQIGLQFLNSFPPEMQVKLFQQFQQLPPDKQQQLYQSLPMQMRASSENNSLQDSVLLDSLPKSKISRQQHQHDTQSIKHETQQQNEAFSTNTLPPLQSPSINSIAGVPNNLISEIIGDLANKKSNFPVGSNKIPTPQELAAQYQQRTMNNGSPEVGGPSISPDTITSSLPPITNGQTTISQQSSSLNMLDLRLMYHYTTKVWHTITDAGISDSKIWSDDIPLLAFKYPFLMHSVLAFSATHLSRNERGLDQCVTCHRAEALRLLREAVLEMSPENTDALVASALILIMDSLANASLPTSSSIKALPPSAWIFHVKGAATILTAVWPLSEKSRFYKFISVDLGDLGDIGYDLISGELANTSDSNENSRSSSVTCGDSQSTKLRSNKGHSLSDLARSSNDYKKPPKSKFSTIRCFDEEISDMFPVSLTSPYFPTLAYMAKLYSERDKSDFILRIFAFPALLDKRFLGLLINCDLSAMRIMRCYYRLLRNFTEQMKDKVWFLEGVSSVLPADVEQYAGGGGMHMMLDFLGGPATLDDDGNGENYVAKSAAQSGLLDTNNLPSASMNDNSLRYDGELNNDS